MQFKNPFIDNLSKVMADAFGAAHSAKNEAENVFKTWLDGWLADRDFVTRYSGDEARIPNCSRDF